MNADAGRTGTAPVTAVLTVLAVLVAVASPARGQERAAAPTETAATADTATTRGVSPGGAFLRSMLIPGWGHAAVGDYVRGGFYFAAEAGTGWMLFKTLSFLDAAREKRDALETDARARLQARGIMDPDSVTTLLEENEALQAAESLVRAREAQREDWLALGIFFLLLGGADAFVSSHLAGFPQPVNIDAALAPGADRVELTVSVPWNGPGG